MAALAIACLPLAVLLLFALTTAPSGDSPAYGNDPYGPGALPSPAFTSAGLARDGLR